MLHLSIGIILDSKIHKWKGGLHLSVRGTGWAPYVRRWKGCHIRVGVAVLSWRYPLLTSARLKAAVWKAKLFPDQGSGPQHFLTHCSTVVCLKGDGLCPLPSEPELIYQNNHCQPPLLAIIPVNPDGGPKNGAIFSPLHLALPGHQE